MDYLDESPERVTWSDEGHAYTPRDEPGPYGTRDTGHAAPWSPVVALRRQRRLVMARPMDRRRTRPRRLTPLMVATNTEQHSGGAPHDLTAANSVRVGHAEHIQPPVAERGGPPPVRNCGSHASRCRRFCGLLADCER